MKRYIAIIAALALAAAPASGQAFLNKLKEKAEQAVGGAISGAIGNKVNNAAQGMIPEDVRQMAEAVPDEGQQAGLGVVSGEQALPPRRESSFGWDGPVTPSSAKFPIPLMNELPAVPSAAELANPTEEKQIAYYKAIKAVTLRAEELNENSTCEDAETLMWRDKSNKMLRDMFGLTDAEIKELEDENLPEAERQRLEEKISKAILGDLDVNSLESQFGAYENMSEADAEKMMKQKTTSALFGVYDRNAAGLKKYCGVSAEEFKAASRAQMDLPNPNQSCPEMKALEAKIKAYQKDQSAANPSFKKEADAFEAKLKKETMDATMAASGMGSLGGVMGKMAEMQQKMAPVMELERKMSKYVSDIQKLMVLPEESAITKFSASDRKKLLALKEQIYKTSDPNVYNPLYLQALELIRTYRERAAAVWAADVQKRFDTMKGNLSSLIKINRQAVADQLIPECAQWRMPLNYVISAGDVLEEAYSEFPCEYPPMYNEEIIREMPLSSVPGGTGHAWFPEFSVFGASHFDEIAAGKYLFASNENGEVFQFAGGSWSKLTDKRVKELSEMKKGAAASGGSWTSRDGKRKVTFNGEGGYIVLPEGNEIFQPHAWKAFADKIQWINAATTEDGKYQLILCTYKF